MVVVYYFDQQEQMVFAPMRNGAKLVLGSTLVLTGNVFDSPDMSLSSLVGTYTYSQSSVDANETETRSIFDAWIVFNNTEEKIHFEWFSNKQSNEGNGAILGGSGFYARASGAATITPRESVSGYEVHLVIYV